MSKHGPSTAETVRELACAIAMAIGKFSDDKWHEGDWFMTLVLASRKLADQLVAGELDDRMLTIYQHLFDPPPPGAPTEVPSTWVMQTPAPVKP